MTGQHIVALDVGGSSVKSATIDYDTFTVYGLRTDEMDSYGDRGVIIRTLSSTIAAQAANIETGRLLAVAAGFPGPFDYAEGISLMKGGGTDEAGVSHTGGRSKFEAIYQVNVRQALREALGLPDLPIVFRNDAEAAIVGEATYGAGRPFDRVIGITLGTGLGSAFVAGGRVVSDATTIPPNGWLYCEPYRDAQADESFSTRGLLRLLRHTSGSFDDVQTAASAARAGNDRAVIAFHQFGRELRTFMSPYVRAFNASAVLVMGGIANAFDLFQATLNDDLGAPALHGMLGPQAALLGAADLVRLTQTL